MVAENQLVRLANKRDRVFRDAPASHPDDIHRHDFRFIAASRQHVRRNILRGTASARDEAACSQRGEVVHHRISRHDAIVMHMDMTTQ